MGMDSLTTLYHFPEGEKILSTKVVDEPIFSVTRMVAEEEIKPIVYKNNTNSRELFSLAD